MEDSGPGLESKEVALVLRLGLPQTTSALTAGCSVAAFIV